LRGVRKSVFVYEQVGFCAAKRVGSEPVFADGIDVFPADFPLFFVGEKLAYTVKTTIDLPENEVSGQVR
jgi:hypothetical protein